MRFSVALLFLKARPMAPVMKRRTSFFASAATTMKTQMDQSYHINLYFGIFEVFNNPNY
jgi:hypothetical protein